MINLTIVLAEEVVVGVGMVIRDSKAALVSCRIADMN